MRLANAMARLGTETAFEVLAKARALEKKGRDIVHLEIGEPDFDTPAHIREAAKKAIDKGFTHYGPAEGLPQTREAVAEHVSKTRGIKVSPEEVIITPGGKPIMFFAMLALVSPGDEVIYPNPGFPIYESMIEFVGARAVPLPLREQMDFNFNMNQLEALISPRTRLLILNSPGNPTGNMIDEEGLARIARILAKFPNVMVLSDEVYSRIIYKGRHRSIAEFPGMKDRTIILDSFSKAYAMTGWRIGYGVARKPLIAAMGRLATNCHSCTNSFVQMAAIEALKGPQEDVQRMTAEFRKRRDVIVGGLSTLPGFSCRVPSAAFYVFPNIEGTGRRSQELADFLLNEAGVACLPGTSFGAFGEGYLRFSYANSIENIEKAVGLISTALIKNAVSRAHA